MPIMFEIFQALNQTAIKYQPNRKCLILLITTLFLIACAESPPPPTIEIPTFPQKAPVYVSEWDDFRIKTISLDINEETYVQQRDGTRTFDSPVINKAEIKNYIHFIVSSLGIDVVDSGHRPDCTLLIDFRGTAIPWNSKYYLAGNGILEMKLVSENNDPIVRMRKLEQGRHLIGGDKFSTVTGTPEFFKRSEDPKNYDFRKLWTKELPRFMADIFGQMVHIYDNAYEAHSEGSYSVFNPRELGFSETIFNAYITSINHDSSDVRRWAIFSLQQFFPKRPREKVVPYLPRIVLFDPDQNVRWSAFRFMNDYTISQKYVVIPTMIELLTAEDSFLSKSAHDALMKVSMNDFGYDTARWNIWWNKNHAKLN